MFMDNEGKLTPLGAQLVHVSDPERLKLMGEAFQQVARAIGNIGPMLERGLAEAERQSAQAGRLMGETLVDLHKRAQNPPSAHTTLRGGFS